VFDLRYGGGGAEAHTRFKQYEYRANSSLVWTTDSRPRDTHEPTGEPESLHGRIDPRTFGDRAYRGRRAELDEKLTKSKKKDRDPGQPSEAGNPKTKETRAAYEAMLSVIQTQLGGQPLNIVSGAADEILAVLKNDTLKNPDKKDIEKLLNPISGQVFDQLVSIGRLITDFQDGGGEDGNNAVNGEDALDDDVGVAVEFEENDADEDEYDLDIVQEDGEEEEEDVMEGDRNNGLQMGGGMDDDESQDGNEGMTLNVQDIDAYWLQRKISQAYDQQIDPQQSQTLAEENRLKIVWCTRLPRAEDQEKRKQIEEEMTGMGPDLVAILEQLRQLLLEKSIREEAKRLKDESGGGVQRGVADMDTDNGYLIHVHTAATILDKNSLVKYDRKSGYFQ
ncbi:DExH-box ATP-dependent RNA helicase DExH12-like protein, partial [Tanacetum coccineum]